MLIFLQALSIRGTYGVGKVVERIKGAFEADPA